MHTNSVSTARLNEKTAAFSLYSFSAHLSLISSFSPWSLLLQLCPILPSLSILARFTPCSLFCTLLWAPACMGQREEWFFIVPVVISGKRQDNI